VLSALLLLALGGCIVDELSAVGRPCPCGGNTVCDKTIARCVPLGDGSVIDGDTAADGSADGQVSPPDGAQPDRSPDVEGAEGDAADAGGAD
jgi:hypothetical protein